MALGRAGSSPAQSTTRSKKVFKKILCLCVLCGSFSAFAQNQNLQNAHCSAKCFAQFSTLRADSLKNLQEMLRLQEQMENKTQMKKDLYAWQIKLMDLERAHSLKSLEILQEIKQNELDEKTCQDFIERLKLTSEMTKLSKELFTLIPDENGN